MLEKFGIEPSMVVIEDRLFFQKTFEQELVWIRLLGIPLYLWSDKMFKEIEKKYSGWLETEEETSLRNHLRWTRLRVEGPPDFMRSTIQVELEELITKIPIWVERTTIV